MSKRLVILTALAVLMAVVSTHRSVFGQKDKTGRSPVVGPQAAIFNSRLAIQVASDGRFNMGAFPNPVTGGGQAGSFDLMYRWPETPSTSFSTIRIDGANFRYGSSGVLVEPPTNIDSATNRSKWQIGDIEVTQIVQIVFNNQTGQEDAARISYTLRNTGTATHTVGERVMIDTEINQNDGAPYRIPGAGIITTETEFLGSAVPNTFQAFFNVTDSQRVAAGTLVGGGATAPDRFVLARWPQIDATDYEYVVTPGVSFTSDSAYAVYWNPTALAAGGSRTYVTYYGLSNVDVNLEPPLALGVSAPVALSVVNNQYSPNPFDVLATVFNNGTATATNVELTINLPGGLSLAAGSATQSLGDLPVGQERQVSWSVRAAPQSVQTTLTYSVTASANNAQDKTLQKQITLPALLSDSDGDGLPDEWEIHGYTSNGHFVDLPAMGANPNHKDIFVEVDYMAGHQPSQTGVIDKIRQSFTAVPNALFPIPNPDGLDGITLHVKVDEEIPHIDQLGSNNNGMYVWADFDQIKQMHFDQSLVPSFHYCVFAHDGPRLPDGRPNSGISKEGQADFLVTLGSWPRGILLGFEYGEGGTDSFQAGTFMHELGHNLGLCHGGPANISGTQCDVNFKPNYLSVMNYSFQFTGLRNNGNNGLFDYSRFSLASLNENHLDERIGLNGGNTIDGYGTSWWCSGSQKWTSNANNAINWNCNKTLLFFDNIEADVAADINKDNAQTVLLSFNDWANVDLKRGGIGSGVPPPPEMQTPVNEIDIETARSILPAAPMNLTARFELNGIHLAWTPVGPINEFSYKVYRSAGSGPFTLLLSTDSASVTDPNPVLSTSGSYYVTAVGTLGGESSPSNVVTTTAFSFCLEDDTSHGSFVLINASSGDYSFFCNGVPIASGQGTLTVRGSSGSLDHNKGDRRVHIQWDTSAQGGKGAGTAIVQLGPNNTKCQITDRDMSNNTCTAPVSPPRTVIKR